MTAQEIIFFKRVAECMGGAEINEQNLLTAAKQVIADDARLVAKVCGSADFRKAASKHLANEVYEKLRTRS